MGDESRGIKFFPEYFEPSTSSTDQEHSQTTLSDLRTNIHPRSDNLWWVHRKLQSASYMLNLFSLRGLSWGSGTDTQEKVVLTAAELSSLRSDITDLEEREAHLKARLEHLDEILRSARLSGYLYIRTRWATLPGEPPPIDDTEVDDWLPRFLVLYGPCIYLYLSSTDLSPQDSTLLSDVVDVGSLPNLKRENEETCYCFYILTRHGPRYECASASKMQVGSWLAALKRHCSLGSGH